MKTSRLPSAPVRSFASGHRYPGLRGKVVDWVEGKFEEGLLSLHVRFTDKTELCWRITTRMTIEEAKLSNWKSGDFAACVLVMLERSSCRRPRTVSGGRRSDATSPQQGQ